jgi:hypothetical protein
LRYSIPKCLYNQRDEGQSNTTIKQVTAKHIIAPTITYV